MLRGDPAFAGTILTAAEAERHVAGAGGHTAEIRAALGQARVGDEAPDTGGTVTHCFCFSSFFPGATAKRTHFVFVLLLLLLIFSWMLLVLLLLLLLFSFCKYMFSRRLSSSGGGAKAMAVVLV